VATTLIVFTPDEFGAFLETDDLLNRQFTFGSPRLSLHTYPCPQTAFEPRWGA
jgi:hypothetical protein